MGRRQRRRDRESGNWKGGQQSREVFLRDDRLKREGVSSYDLMALDECCLDVAAGPGGFGPEVDCAKLPDCRARRAIR